MASTTTPSLNKRKRPDSLETAAAQPDGRKDEGQADCTFPVAPSEAAAPVISQATAASPGHAQAACNAVIDEAAAAANTDPAGKEAESELGVSADALALLAHAGDDDSFAAAESPTSQRRPPLVARVAGGGEAGAGQQPAGQPAGSSVGIRAEDGQPQLPMSTFEARRALAKGTVEAAMHTALGRMLEVRAARAM